MIGYQRAPKPSVTAPASAFGLGQQLGSALLANPTMRKACAGALLAVTSLVGCVPGGEGKEPNREIDVSGQMPPIYIDIKEEDLVDGKNPGIASYLKTLELCRNAGAPIRELSPEQVQKIGTWRRQSWYASEFRAGRDERWTYKFEEGAPPGACFLTLDHLGEHYFTDGTTIVSTDLATGETTRQPDLPDALYRMAATGDISRSPDHSGPTMRSIAGQQCLEWTSLHNEFVPGTRMCLWSEGREWGFFAVSAQRSYCGDSRRDNVIVLSEEPLSGTGCRISVQSMTVGKPLSPTAYLPPGMDGGS